MKLIQIYSFGKLIKPGILVLIFLSLIFLRTNQLLAQEPDTLKIPIQEKPIFEEEIEALSEGSDNVLDFTDLTEQMMFYRENPLNLNSATKEQLEQIIFLNDMQIGKLMEYLYTYGSLLTLYELQAIEGWNQVTIEKVLPFVQVSPIKQKSKITLKNVAKYGRSTLFARTSRILEEQAGYKKIPDSIKQLKPNSYYLGSPYQLYVRYNFNYSDQVKIGIVADKDAGEEFFKGSQPNGFDLYSAYFQIKDIGKLRNLIIGDFQAQFGQGLTLWKGLTFGKSPEAVLVKRSAVKLKPSTSANSYNYFRGAAATFREGKIDLSVFYSRIKRDGNLELADTLYEQEDILTSLLEGGYHRTNSEIADKNAVDEMVMGGNLSYSGKNFAVGATISQMTLDSYLKKSDQLYNQFAFQGKSNQNYGMDFNFLISKYLFFGEISRSKNGGNALIGGVNAYLHSAFQLSLIYRNYEKDFQNLLSNAFGENSTNSTEKGLYAGISAKLAPKLSLSAYTDFFVFPWLKFQVDQPSKGFEYSLQTNYSISRTAYVYLRYRFKQKQENEQGLFNNRFASEYSRENLRLNFEYEINYNLSLGNRIELIRTRKQDKTRHGFLISQDIDYNFSSLPFGLSFRYSIFDTDSYDERIYTYENDVLYAFSAPSFFYKGTRTYVLLKCNPSRNIDLWLKAAQTSLINQTTSGSGLDLIDGPNKTEVKLQIRFKF